MNVYDFDNTLYDGESTLDFSIFMIKNRRKILLWMPSILWNFMKYKFCLVNKEKLEDLINAFMRSVIRDKQEILKLSVKFWENHRKNLNTALISQIKQEDMIITACPEFLIDVIKSELVTSNLLCSQVDLDRKRVLYLNFGKNKVLQYQKQCGNKAIDCFYTDSYPDQAMMNISKKVFRVTKGKIKQIT